MLIKSALFGEQNIDPESIISFPAGIPGFDNCIRFKLFHEERKSGIIYWLQSLDDSEVVFSVADPAHFHIHYEFTLSDEETALLEIENDSSDLLVLLMLHKDAVHDLNAPPTIKGSLKWPLIVNLRSRKGLQKILRDFEQTVTLRENRNVIDVTAS